MASIERVKVTQILDSRSNPMIEAEVQLTDEILTRATVPFYESTLLLGGFKQHDKWPESQDFEKINRIIGPELIGKNPTDQTGIDNCLLQLLDGAVNEELRAIGLAVSIAVCKAGARVMNIPLYEHIANLARNKTLVMPVPAFNVINGGSRAGNKLTMQGFKILPVGACSFREAMDMGMRIYFHLEAVIKTKYGQDATNIGYEGGFSSSIQGDNEALGLLKTAIDYAGLTGKVVIGMDVAASKFYGTDKTYDLNFKEKKNDGSQKISGVALKSIYKSYVAEYPVASIENPFNQDDWEHYSNLTSEIGEGVQIVGDNLLANPKTVEKFINKTTCNSPFLKVKELLIRLCIRKKVETEGEITIPKMVEMAINKKSCNALLLEVNQIGSVTESIEAVKMSKLAGWGVMASHRGGETEDFIADLSVGLAMGQIKTGAPCWSERHAVYKKLMQIEEELGLEATYAGANFRKPVEPY
ncbi:enolase 1-like [Macadamia integrifolia]|uniref:enolase 1-like n=1 Tax=Macadamia integrifolia TaxID=60698 RepID=UPI001C5008B0|nr:enolase 1-like [Macadamia integrifolia]